MAVPIFLGSSLKVKNGRRHIAKLESEIEALNARQPGGFIVDYNAEGTANIRLNIDDGMVQELPLTIGDAIHNLRTALDILACDAVSLKGENPKSVHFPFGTDAGHLEGQIKDKHLNRAGDDVVAIVREFKPYRDGGNNLLRALHDLDIADKHALILPIATTRKFGKIALKTQGGGGVVMDGLIDRTGSYKNLFHVRGGPFKVEGDDKVAFDFRFGDDQPLAGEIVVPTLYRLADEVERVLEAFRHYFSGGQRGP